MFLYLSPRIGDGTYENMYQARHAEMDSKRGTINLQSTHFLLSSDTPVAGAIQLGHPSERPAEAASRALLRIGCDVRGESLGEVIFNALRYPTIPNLNPLTPGRKAGGYSICIGGKTLFVEPHIAKKWVNTRVEWQWLVDKYVELRKEGYWHEGAWALAAASVSDDFEGGAQSPATGWTVVSGGAGGAINQTAGGLGEFNPSDTSQDHFMRFDTALDSDDMIVNAIFDSRSSSGGSRCGGGPGARKANDTAETYYYFGQRAGSSNETELAELSSASFSLIGSRDSHSVSAAEDFYVSCDGSTISGGIDAVEFESQTDTTITGNTYAGLYGRSGSSSSADVYWREWSADVISAAGDIVILRRRREEN